MKTKNKTVFVGMSGGVDSSVSAGLLKEQGYTVVGVFIRTWTPDFIECTWRDERRDAMRVCAHLRIPFLECDAEEAYKKGVTDYMIDEYKKGNTPNPDVMCNREVKFGAFWDFAKKHGADFIATGHYAVVAPLLMEEGVGGGGPGISEIEFKSPPRPDLSLRGTPPPQGGDKMQLRKSPDTTKDQSYFLWTLTQDDLAHTFFPVGHMHKTEVRKLAKRYNLPTQSKKDSQGVCFLGPLDMKDFLSHYIESKKGDVVNKNGEVIGFHAGAVFFTLGERHGFTITEKTSQDTPYYVVAKDISSNTITVGTLQEMHHDSATAHSQIDLKDTNWISIIPVKDASYAAQIRYHGEDLECTIDITDSDHACVLFKNPILVSKGQSIVIYDRDICMGGGIVA
jgi:tRNA-uridine 2-sulfurtransferase